METGQSLQDHLGNLRRLLLFRVGNGDGAAAACALTTSLLVGSGEPSLAPVYCAHRRASTYASLVWVHLIVQEPVCPTLEGSGAAPAHGRHRDLGQRALVHTSWAARDRRWCCSTCSLRFAAGVMTGQSQTALAIALF